MTASAPDGAREAAEEVIERFDRYIATLDALGERQDPAVSEDAQMLISFAIVQLRDMVPRWEAIRADEVMLEAAWDAGRAALLEEQAAAPPRHLRVVASG